MANTKSTEQKTERTRTTQTIDTTETAEKKNSLLPNKPWIPESQRLTNREALEILLQKEAARKEKIDKNVPVSDRTLSQEQSVRNAIQSLESGVHRVYSTSREEEQAFLSSIVSSGGGNLSKKSLQGVLNCYRPASVEEAKGVFQDEYTKGLVSEKDLEDIVEVVTAKRAEKGLRT